MIKSLLKDFEEHLLVFGVVYLILMGGRINGWRGSIQLRKVEEVFKDLCLLLVEVELLIVPL